MDHFYVKITEDLRTYSEANIFIAKSQKLFFIFIFFILFFFLFFICLMFVFVILIIKMFFVIGGLALRGQKFSFLTFILAFFG